MPAKSTKTDAEREADFRKFANLYANRAIKSLRKLGGLGGGRYKRTAEQVEKLRTTLRGAVDQATARIEPGATSGGQQDITIV